MTKLETISRCFEEAQREKNVLHREIADLEVRKEALEKDLPKVAAGGDVEAYIEKKTILARCEAELEVKRAVFEHADHPVTEEDARAAWDEYYKVAQADREKAVTAFRKAVDDLYDQLRAVTGVNLEMLRTMKKCMQMSGVSEAFPFSPVRINNEVMEVCSFFKARILRETNDPIAYARMNQINNGAVDAVSNITSI